TTASAVWSATLIAPYPGAPSLTLIGPDLIGPTSLAQHRCWHRLNIQSISEPAEVPPDVRVVGRRPRDPGPGRRVRRRGGPLRRTGQKIPSASHARPGPRL